MNSKPQALVNPLHYNVNETEYVLDARKEFHVSTSS